MDTRVACLLAAAGGEAKIPPVSKGWKMAGWGCIFLENGWLAQEVIFQHTITYCRYFLTRSTGEGSEGEVPGEIILAVFLYGIIFSAEGRYDARALGPYPKHIFDVCGR